MWATTRVRKGILRKELVRKKTLIVEAERYAANAARKCGNAGGSPTGSADKAQTNYSPITASVSCSTTRRRKRCLEAETNWGAWYAHCLFPNAWDFENGTSQIVAFQPDVQN
jgi:hypothetical protein